MKISFEKPNQPKTGILVILLDEGDLTKGHAKALDEACGGQLSRAIEAGKFEGKKEQVLDVLAPGGGLDRVILMGLGKVASLQPREIELLGGAMAGTLQGVNDGGV